MLLELSSAISIIVVSKILYYLLEPEIKSMKYKTSNYIEKNVIYT